MINYFTWSEFDKSVEYITNNCKNLKLSGIYGVPRGGLCLAVALSHKLKIKLIFNLWLSATARHKPPRGTPYMPENSKYLHLLAICSTLLSNSYQVK